MDLKARLNILSYNKLITPQINFIKRNIKDTFIFITTFPRWK